MSYLQRLRAEAEKRAGGEPAKGAEGSFAGFAGRGPGHFADIPSEVAHGLTLLASLPRPRVNASAAWAVAVSDSMRLVTEGWASKALALGWEPLQLWGITPDAPGLAGWLYGRRIRLLHAGSCTVQDEPGRWSVFTARPVTEGCVFLWDYGR